jgi:acylphosphatase
VNSHNLFGVKRLDAVVHGRVQGVGFREFVRHEAATRGLAGYVRNSDDGRCVELVAEGEERALEALVEALHRGPRFARVERVDVAYRDAGNGFSRFSVEL